MSRPSDVALSPSEALRLLQAAEEAMASRKGEVAVQCYRRVIELEPKALRPRLGLFYALVQCLRRDEAIAAHADIDERRDLSTVERFRIAKALEEIDAFELAEAELIKYLDAHPEDADGHRRRAALAHRRWLALSAVRGHGREALVAIGDAKIALRAVIALEPDDVTAPMNLAALWVEEGASADGPRAEEIAGRALRAVQRSLELNPQNEGGYKVLGDVHLFLRGSYAESISSYEKALAIDPHYTEARAMIGVTYVKMGDAEQARTVFEQVIADDPTNETAAEYLRDLK